MNVSEMRNKSLRLEVEKYMTDRLAELRSGKRSSDDTVKLWRSFNEADWQAWMHLMRLRPRAAILGIEPGEIESEMGRRMQSLPRVQLNGVSYCAPYSLGLEVAVLRDLVERTDAEARRARLEAGPRSTVVELFEPGERSYDPEDNWSS